MVRGHSAYLYDFYTVPKMISRCTIFSFMFRGQRVQFLMSQRIPTRGRILELGTFLIECSAEVKCCKNPKILGSHFKITVTFFQATAYGICVSRSAENIRKDLCKNEFEAFQKCINSVVKLSLMFRSHTLEPFTVFQAKTKKIRR